MSQASNSTKTTASPREDPIAVLKRHIPRGRSLNRVLLVRMSPKSNKKEVTWMVNAAESDADIMDIKDVRHELSGFATCLERYGGEVVAKADGFHLLIQRVKEGLYTVDTLWEPTAEEVEEASENPM